MHVLNRRPLLYGELPVGVLSNHPRRAGCAMDLKQRHTQLPSAEQKRTPADRFRLRIRSDSKKRPGLCRSLPVAPPVAWPHDVPTFQVRRGFGWFSAVRRVQESPESRRFRPCFSVTRDPFWVHIFDPEANVSFPVGASRWLDPSHWWAFGLTVVLRSACLRQGGVNPGGEKLFRTTANPNQQGFSGVQMATYLG